MRLLTHALAATVMLISCSISIADEDKKLLLYDMEGTGYYCTVDVSKSLNKAVKALKNLGVNYQLAPFYKIYQGGVKFNEGRLIQIVATGKKGGPCSLALVRSNVKLTPFGSTVFDRFTTHSKPSIVFMEPQHTASEADMVEQFSIHLAIDHLYSQDSNWLIGRPNEWTKEFQSNPSILFRDMVNGKLK